MRAVHQGLAAGRWDEFSLLEQMANVGSEVERALRWTEKGNAGLAARATERALELMDLTLACPSNRGRLREVARAREVLVDFLLGENEYGSSADFLRRYFLSFGMAARGRR